MAVSYTHLDVYKRQALGGRYRTMFDLQAQRFNVPEEEGATYETL